MATMRPITARNQTQVSHELLLNDGTVLRVRPIRPDDEPLLASFHFTLSDESVYSRYFAFLDIQFRVKHERLARQCSIDHDHDMAFIALLSSEADATIAERTPDRIVGVGRLSESDGSGIPEIAVVVSDAFQHHGIGSALVRNLIDFAREKRFAGLRASILPDNRPMQQLLEHQGFKFTLDTEDLVMNGQMLLKY